MTEVPDPNRKTYLGMRDGDLDGEWFAKYWNPNMKPLPDHIVDALNVSPVATELCLPFDKAGTLLDDGYQDLENGYSLLEDGSMHIAVHTHMPRVEPIMWDWWFWWHGTQTERYKLWYPRAHLYSALVPSDYDESTPYRDRYIGLDSYVDEYVGESAGQLVIQFRDPELLGLDVNRLSEQGATAIVGIVGMSGLPLDWGYLMHYVRPVPGGSEMRSRFWMGGPHVKARGDATLPDEASGLVEALSHMDVNRAREMVIHCSSEMNHLAEFLPAIYAEHLERNE